MARSSSKPTARQREYLTFIKAFTARWAVPPSFDDIGRHFRTTPPAVNSMVKTLEARGFLSRVPGAARTLRVLFSDDELEERAPPTAEATSGTTQIDALVRLASVTVERLVPSLRGADRDVLNGALGAVAEALDVTLRGAGASEEQRRVADETLRRVASIARGDSTETRPGRRLAWWRRLPRG